jgi:hypothetical protein
MMTSPTVPIRGAIVAACGERPERAIWASDVYRPERPQDRRQRVVKVTLLYFDGCPNWHVTDGVLESLRSEIGFDLDRRNVNTAEDAERLQFRGSPTVLVDEEDVFATGDEPVGLSCRIYRTDDGIAGAPTETQLRSVLLARFATTKDPK